MDIEKIVELAKSQIQVYYEHLAAALLGQDAGKIGDQEKLVPIPPLHPRKDTIRVGFAGTLLTSNRAARRFTAC